MLESPLQQDPFWGRIINTEYEDITDSFQGRADMKALAQGFLTFTPGADIVNQLFTYDQNGDLAKKVSNLFLLFAKDKELLLSDSQKFALNYNAYCFDIALLIHSQDHRVTDERDLNLACPIIHPIHGFELRLILPADGYVTHTLNRAADHANWLMARSSDEGQSEYWYQQAELQSQNALDFAIKRKYAPDILAAYIKRSIVKHDRVDYLAEHKVEFAKMIALYDEATKQDLEAYYYFSGNEAEIFRKRPDTGMGNAKYRQAVFAFFSRSILETGNQLWTKLAKTQLSDLSTFNPESIANILTIQILNARLAAIREAHFIMHANKQAARVKENVVADVQYYGAMGDILQLLQIYEKQPRTYSRLQAGINAGINRVQGWKDEVENDINDLEAMIGQELTAARMVLNGDQTFRTRK